MPGAKPLAWLMYSVPAAVNVPPTEMKSLEVPRS